MGNSSNHSNRFVGLILTLVTIFHIACDELGSKFLDSDTFFNGVDSFSFDQAGKLTIKWKLLSEQGQANLDYIYEIFVIDNTEGSKLNMTSVNGSYHAQMIYDPLQRVPSEDPIAAVKDRNSFTFAWDYEAGRFYSIIVVARKLTKAQILLPTSRLEFGVRTDKPLFGGLEDSGVELSSDGKVIRLSWAAAESVMGNVQYLIFDNDSFTNPIATTERTVYQIHNVVMGKTYRFGVRARDSRGQDNNTQVVEFLVPDARDKIAPDFDGLEIAHAISDHKVHLQWTASEATDLSRYFVFSAENPSEALAATSANFYIVEGLLANTEYAYMVKATDVSGNIDSNERIIKVKTLDYEVPDFQGLKAASALPGIEGLSAISLNWQPAVFANMNMKDSAGYLVYKAHEDQSIDFDAKAYAVIEDPAATQYQVEGLSEETSYKFVVRAFYREQDETIKSELNMLEKTVSTLSPKAPSFSGLENIEAIMLDQGKSSVLLEWKTPKNDGIWAGFKIDYEQGVCSKDEMISKNMFKSPGVQSILSEGLGKRSHQISNLEKNQSYRFRVRTHFQANGISEALNDDNSRCLDFIPQAIAPIFAGISQVVKFNDVRDFTSAKLSWLAPMGDCDAIEIYSSNTNNLFNFDAPIKTIGCDQTEIQIDNLMPYTNYYFKAKARYDDSDKGSLFSKDLSPISLFTAVKSPSGDGVTHVDPAPISAGIGKLNLKWDLPDSSVGWNKLYIWSAAGLSASEARRKVIAKADGMPAETFIASIEQSENWQDTKSLQQVSSTLGAWNCYLVKAAFHEEGYYVASKNEATRCYNMPLSPPTFSGVRNAVYLSNQASDSDSGYGWLQLNFHDIPGGSIEEYHVFYSPDNKQSSFDLSLPLAKIRYGDPILDEDPSDSNILLKLPLSQIKSGYFTVQAISPFIYPENEPVVVSDYFQGIEGEELGSDLFVWQAQGSTAEISTKFGDLAFENVSLIRGTKLSRYGNITGDIEIAMFGSIGPCQAAPEGSCIWDHSSLAAWQVRYYQIMAQSNGLVRRSPVFAHAKVPEGMAYIDRHLWPKEEGATYKPWETYSFAMDKFEVSLKSGSLVDDGTEPFNSGDGILKSVGSGTPLIEKNWFSYKRGCDNRTGESSAFADSTADAHPSRRVRLQTGQEFVIASYGTPDKGGQGFCNVDFRGKPAAPDASDASDNSGCISFFGVRNMIGNQREWTDELLHDGNFIRFYGSNANDQEILAVPIFSETDGAADIGDFDLSTAFPVMGSRAGSWTGSEDRVWQDWNVIGNRPIEQKARAVARGGDWRNLSRAGRFMLSLRHQPSTRHSLIGGRCTLSSPAPGNIRLQNDSNGDKARLRWRLWGSKADTSVRLGIAKTKDKLTGWKGSSAEGSILSDFYTADGFHQCTDYIYNSDSFENPRNRDLVVIGPDGSSMPYLGNLMEGKFGLQGRCGIDISGLAPWEKRYVQLYAEHGPTKENIKSEILVIARVPSGMVFVSADDWPDSSKHRLASEYGESYLEPFDFAIDKYEASMDYGNYPDCKAEEFPCSTDAHLVSGVWSRGTYSIDWYSFKQGCDNRTKLLGPEWVDDILEAGDPSGRRVHLATGLEWLVASFETPDSSGSPFCNTNSSAQKKDKETDRCMSRYGAQDMIGNLFEWTNEIISSDRIDSFWTSQSGGYNLQLDTIWTTWQGVVTGWNFDLAFPVITSTQNEESFHHKDYVWWNPVTLINQPEDTIAVLRGGAWYNGSGAGRFTVEMTNSPTRKAGFIGGRCALRAPK